MIRAVIEALTAWLTWQAENAKQKSLYGIHDRFQIQKNRVHAIRKNLLDDTAAGSDVNDLRLLENELAIESRYLRTLENHLARWQDRDG